MDIIFIENLQIETIIGVYDWERNIKQIVSVDIEMGTDIRLAAAHDDLNYAIDYKAVSDRLVAFIQTSQFQLIETMAEQCAEIIIREFNVIWLRLRVNKPNAVPGAKNVAVQIERTRINSEVKT